MKRIKRKVIEAMIKQHPNDAELGAEIRKSFTPKSNLELSIIIRIFAASTAKRKYSHGFSPIEVYLAVTLWGNFF